MKNMLLRAVAIVLILLSASVFAVSCKDKDDDKKDDDKKDETETNQNQGGNDAPIIDENGNFNGGGYVGEWDTEDFQ